MYIQAKTLFDEYEARLILFSAIEPGHTGWSQEIQRVGAVTVLHGLLGGEYDSKSCSKPLRFGPKGAIQLESNASVTNFLSVPPMCGEDSHIFEFI